ncbi:MAG: ABC transporter permease [Anaerolineae bacterium]|nr:ABC transporter permease [Anaerolineae bacterium]
MNTTPETVAPAGVSPRYRTGPAWISVVSRVWAWFFLLILVIFFSLANAAFLSVASAMNILITAAPVLLMAIGQTYVIISSGIDLSVGYTMGLASVVCALTMKGLFDGGMAETPAILIGFVAGVAVTVIPGLINGLLIARIKVPPFIATLGMYNVARGAAMLLSGAQTVTALPPHLTDFGNGFLFYVLRDKIFWFTLPEGLDRADLREVARILPYPVIITAIVTVIMAFVLAKMRFGRRTYAIGGNQEAATRAGIPVNRHKIQLYILSAVLAGIAGILYTARFTGGSHIAGEAALLDTVAAVVIGGASLNGGSGTVAGTVVGALVISVLTVGLVIMNVPPFWQFVAVGCVVVIAVIIDQASELLRRER